ncbi:MULTISPECIES: CHAP domain-containing protein [Dehalobacter]|jgi:hypothetical protein|uniref:CHAP domain-containing protein n=2 Tax=Dehalobacter restrictus TaxID=55583 RepID=A0A857DIS8_9FIRM|nr:MULTISPECIES: CHAP domain-containing protein [Dehalobacter]AHF09819.1 hypothetical protein DEHRE_06780 [Dehalobacter restrictus DSM 9455]MCG1026106.1 CHAP domain-containing protein [Dehalobacter sp.]MDJ0305033.1 CHAP domain-containing protein [Dehalobacter sp.]OCZ53440.1 hypothetical protein A7D23_07775 [Dehalobacter sp. TeCB1]QHA00402.1 CHAP domain-containing protein [Dehalobacter restrictus]
MKKRLMACILVITMLLSVGATTVFADDATTSLVYDSQNSFNFSMTPKSKEWKNYSSVQLKEMLNIPLSTAEKMDTATLLKTVLDYPFMIDIFAYDNTTQGFEGLSLEFNGAAVLLQRADLTENLKTIYKNTIEKMMAVETKNNISDKEIMQKKFMESLFVYPKVSNMLSQDEKYAIVELSKQISNKFQTSPLVMERTAVTAAAPGDILGYGYVYTPMLQQVLVLRLQDLTSADKASINASYDAAYPTATRLGTATYNYNCHSYAWYLASTGNTWWMNDPSAYMSGGGYTQVTPPQAGDKVYWTNTHSGIVYSVNGSNITVTSKWGAAGLYRHPINDCPYSVIIVKTFWRR